MENNINNQNLENKEYIINQDNASYKITIIREKRNLIIKIKSNDDIKYYYYKKYNLSDLIKIINVKIYDSLEKIIGLIDEAYSHNNISIILNYKYNIILKIKYPIGYQDYGEFQLNLYNKTYKLNEKFEVLFKELNSLKNDKNILIYPKINEIENLLHNLKNEIYNKLNKYMEQISDLKSKLENNNNLLKKNDKLIKQAKEEMINLINQFKEFKKSKQNEMRINKDKKDKSIKITNKNIKDIIQDNNKFIEANNFNARKIYCNPIYQIYPNNNYNRKTFNFQKSQEKVHNGKRDSFDFPKISGKKIILNKNCQKQFKGEKKFINPSIQKNIQLMIKADIEPIVKEEDNPPIIHSIKAIQLKRSFIQSNENLSKINLNEINENKDKIKEFRKNYELSEDEFTDEYLLRALKENDFVYIKAFGSLYNY